MFDKELFDEEEELLGEEEDDDDEVRGSSTVTSLPTFGDDNKLVIESMILDFITDL